jgi:hypothetical protein
MPTLHRGEPMFCNETATLFYQPLSHDVPRRATALVSPAEIRGSREVEHAMRFPIAARKRRTFCAADEDPRRVERQNDRAVSASSVERQLLLLTQRCRLTRVH